MNNQYLIPANTKKGQLIFSIFRPIDLAIAVTGVSLTFILLIIFSNLELSTWVSILAVVPLLISFALVFPVANYHNVLVAIQELIAFYSSNRNYKWRGWCAVYESGVNNRGARPSNVRPGTNPKVVPAGHKAPPKKNSVYTENWVRIRSIKDGIITLPNKEMVTGVKIEPRNIFILDDIEQDNIINALRNCYNTFNFEFWLIAADRPVDISVYTSQLELMLNSNLSPARRKMVMQDLDKANMFINNQVVDTEYYVLFKETNRDRLDDKLRAMINGFAKASLLASQTTDDELRVILDNFLNGGVRTNFGTVVIR